jgi:hypothetical protein
MTLIAGTIGDGAMDYTIEEIQQDVWRVNIAGISRIVRYRHDTRAFTPWDVTTADGHKLWSATSLESALRWIQARTGHPVEALFAQTLLERTVPSTDSGVKVPEESAEIRQSGRPAQR